MLRIFVTQMLEAPLPLRVKLRKTHAEHKFSGLPPIADHGVTSLDLRRRFHPIFLALTPPLVR